MLFDKKVVLFHQHAETKEEALKILTDKLVEAGVVREDFLTGILNREANFPTGLLTDSVNVAIPHTDPEYVKENQLAFLQLDEPVTFRYMADPDEEVPVSIIMMMAIQGHDQVDMLMKLMGMFGDTETLDKLASISTYEEFEVIVKEAGLID